jgi:hypothetical protein
MRTKRTSVTFHNAFKLDAFEATLPAGTYEVATLDADANKVPSHGWKRVSLSLRTPSIEDGQGPEQWTNIGPTDLEAAFMRDTGTAVQTVPKY